MVTVSGNPNPTNPTTKYRCEFVNLNFIYTINILCYAPSVFTCIVGGAIQMTVYIYINILLL